MLNLGLVWTCGKGLYSSPLFVCPLPLLSFASFCSAFITASITLHSTFRSSLFKINKEKGVLRHASGCWLTHSSESQGQNEESLGIFSCWGVTWHDDDVCAAWTSAPSSKSWGKSHAFVCLPNNLHLVLPLMKRTHVAICVCSHLVMPFKVRRWLLWRCCRGSV